jgi:hypothetical protein
MKMVACVFVIGVLMSVGVRASADNVIISEESRAALLGDLGEIRGLLSEVKAIWQEGEKRNLREEEHARLEELRKLIEEKDSQLKDKIKKVEEEKQQLKEKVVVQQAAITPQLSLPGTAAQLKPLQSPEVGRLQPPQKGLVSLRSLVNTAVPPSPQPQLSQPRHHSHSCHSHHSHHSHHRRATCRCQI